MKKIMIKCPRCGNQTFWHDNPFKPFCSEKCRLIDLGSWVDEEYRIDAGQAPRKEEESSF